MKCIDSLATGNISESERKSKVNPCKKKLKNQELNKSFLVYMQLRSIYLSEKRGYRQAGKNSFRSGAAEDFSVAWG